MLGWQSKFWRMIITRGGLLLFGVVLLALLLGRLLYSPDFMTPITSTADRLRTIEHAVSIYVEDGGNLDSCDSTITLLDRLSTTGYLYQSDTTMRRLQSDYWGEPFRWTAESSGGVTLIKIHSSGADGVFDNTDDVILEMNIDLMLRKVHSMIKYQGSNLFVR